MFAPQVIQGRWLGVEDLEALQQKCYAHHHKAIREAKALHPHQGEGFLCEVEAMLRAAVALQQQKALLSLETFSHLRQALEHKAVQLLEPPRSEPNEEAVRNRLNKPFLFQIELASPRRLNVILHFIQGRQPGFFEFLSRLRRLSALRNFRRQQQETIVPHRRGSQIAFRILSVGSELPDRLIRDLYCAFMPALAFLLCPFTGRSEFGLRDLNYNW